MGLRQAGQGLLTLGSEDQPGDAGVVGIRSSFHQTGLLDPVDQLACAVVSQEEVVGDLADSGSAWVLMPAHGQEQLVLGRPQPGLSGLGFAPPNETAQPGAQGQQALIVGVGQRGRRRGQRNSLPVRAPTIQGSGSGRPMTSPHHSPGR